MIELKTLEIETFRFIDITLFLPRWTCRMIVSTKAALVDESWDLDVPEADCGVSGAETGKRRLVKRKNYGDDVNRRPLGNIYRNEREGSAAEGDA